MSDDHDEVFADDVSDDGGALDSVRALVRARQAETARLDLAAQRAEMDDRGARAPLPAGWSATRFDLGRPGELLRGPSAAITRSILYLHGGGFCMGAPKSHRALAAQIGHAAQAEVFTLAYRLAPEHRAPAALEDALDAYRRLLATGRDARSIALIGDSAGGGLALHLAAALKSAGLPAPLAVVAISPWVDLTLTGSSLRTRAARDPALTQERLATCAGHFVGDGDARAASALFADLAGLPPVLVHVGDDEILLSDAERFISAARAVGVDATVEIWPGLFHVWHAYFPMIEEAREAISEIGAWLKRRWP